MSSDRMKRSREEPQRNNNNNNPFSSYGEEPFQLPLSSTLDSGDESSPTKKRQKHDPANHEDSPTSKTPNVKEIRSSNSTGNNIIVSSSGKQLASLQQQRYNHGQQDPELELIPVRQPFKEAMSSSIVLINRLKDFLEPNLVGKWKQLLEIETNIDYLLQLNSPLNNEFEEVGNKAGKGVRLLQEGLCLLNEAKNLLRSVINKFDSNDRL